MALNEMIAQGAQFKMPDPLEQYGRIAQIQQAQNQNALAQYQINSAKRADETNTNFLSSLRAAGDDPAKVRQALINAGKVKEAGELDASALTRQKVKGEIQKLNREDFTARMQDINNNTSNENIEAHRQDIKANPNYTPAFQALVDTKFTELLNMSVEDRAKATKFIGMTGAEKSTAAKSSETPEVVNMRLLGYPLTQAGFQAYRDAQRPERLRTPAEEAQAIRIANASRAPTQPVAPTVTSIQDPTNPSQMISINARDYKGGGLGSPGVIGLTGKTPAATAKQDVVDKGNAQLSSVLDDLRSSYDTLEKAAAIPSTQRGVLSNLASSAQASGLGQALGRMGGTEEQSARDTINSSRMMLLNSIKQATGMSAQQLNSNVELKSWLQAVSDPTQSIETVSKVLGNIEKFVASGGKYSAKKEGAPVAVPGKPAPAAVVAPPPGFKRD